jgi:hypothetical protein
MDTPVTISDRSKPARQTKHLTIGALIFPRMDQIDFTGPFEVLSRIPNSTIHVIAKNEIPNPGYSGADSDTGNEYRRGA